MNSTLIKLHGQEWLDRQRIAGKCVSRVLKHLNQIIVDKVPNLTTLDLEHEAMNIIDQEKCIPTFYKYRGFPGKICVSVNKELVHGIPSNYTLKEGDVVKFDLGATFEGAIADAASTAIYGEGNFKHKEMIRIGKEALTRAIQSISIGKQIGCIGYAISKYVKQYSGYGLIIDYGGHSLDWLIPHAPPFIANKAQFNEGVRIQAGMTLAIEPLIVCGSDTTTSVLSDNWTVMTKDISSHEENSIYIHDDNTIEVLTKWN